MYNLARRPAQRKARHKGLFSFKDTAGIPGERVLFPNSHYRFATWLNEMRPYLLKGKVKADFTAVTLTGKGESSFLRQLLESQKAMPY